MNKIELEFSRQLGTEYDKSGKPTVYFFDHALNDEPASELADRPIFKNAVYISKRSKTSHETQEFHRKANADDQLEFQAEWQHYLKVRDNLAKPRIGLLPEIDKATVAEMNAQDIYSLEQLTEFQGDCFENWQTLARSILNVTAQRSERRETVSGNDSQRTERVLEGIGRSTATGIFAGESYKEESGKEKDFQEKSIQKENITFSYEIAI